MSIASELSISQRNITYQITNIQFDSQFDSHTISNKLTNITLLVQLFTNPDGFSFELICSRKASCVVHGKPVQKASWFPGYTWQPISCAQCGAHIGWKFTVNPDLGLDGQQSSKFYGLIETRVVSSRLADIMLASPNFAADIWLAPCGTHSLRSLVSTGFSQ